MKIANLLNLKLGPKTNSTKENSWLVCALGNPGIQYEETRHNAAWIVLNNIETTVYNSDWRQDNYINGLIGRSMQKPLPNPPLGGEGTCLHWLKPTTFMNLSGEAVSAACKKWDISPDHVIVLHDEVDIAMGKFKISHTGGDGNHNGVKSIIQQLGTRDFIRIRIGIGGNNRRAPLNDFVMGKFTLRELQTLREIAPTISQCIETIIAEGLVMAMNKFNK